MEINGEKEGIDRERKKGKKKDFLEDGTPATRCPQRQAEFDFHLVNFIDLKKKKEREREAKTDVAPIKRPVNNSLIGAFLIHKHLFK